MKREIRGDLHQYKSDTGRSIIENSKSVKSVRKKLSKESNECYELRNKLESAKLPERT